MRALGLAIALVMGACGCGGGGGGGTTTVVAAEFQGPIRSSDVAHGEQVVNTVCMACHSGGPALNNLGLEPGRVRQQVRNGGGRMPALPATRVSDDDLEAALAYLTTIGGVTGDLPPATGGGENPPPPTDGAAPATN